jgi:hypothetical protein
LGPAAVDIPGIFGASVDRTGTIGSVPVNILALAVGRVYILASLRGGRARRPGAEAGRGKGPIRDHAYTPDHARPGTR